jgi:hypothetical protein
LWDTSLKKPRSISEGGNLALFQLRHTSCDVTVAGKTGIKPDVQADLAEFREFREFREFDELKEKGKLADGKNKTLEVT